METTTETHTHRKMVRDKDYNTCRYSNRDTENMNMEMEMRGDEVHRSAMITQSYMDRV